MSRAPFVPRTTLLPPFNDMESNIPCKLCGVRQASVYCRNDDAFLCGICDTAVHNSFNVLAHHHERILLEEARVMQANRPQHNASYLWEAGDGSPGGLAAQTSDSLSSGYMDTLFMSPFDIERGYSPLDGFFMQSRSQDCGFPPYDHCVPENDGVVPRGLDSAVLVEARGSFSPHTGQHIITTGDRSPAFPALVPEPRKAQEYAPVMPKETACNDWNGGKRRPLVLDEPQLHAQMGDRNKLTPTFEDKGSKAGSQPPRTMTIRTRAATLAAAQGTVLHRECGNGTETRADKLARYRAKRARRSFVKTVRYETRRVYAEVRPRIKGRFVTFEELACYRATGAIHPTPVPLPQGTGADWLG